MLNRVTWSPLFLETPPAAHPGDAFLTLADQELALVAPGTNQAQQNLQNLATGILASRRAHSQLSAILEEGSQLSLALTADERFFNLGPDLARAQAFEAVFSPAPPAITAFPPLPIQRLPAAPAAPVYVPPPPSGPRLPPGIRPPMIP